MSRLIHLNVHGVSKAFPGVITRGNFKQPVSVVKIATQNPQHRIVLFDPQVSSNILRGLNCLNILGHTGYRDFSILLKLRKQGCGIKLKSQFSNLK